MALNAIFNPVLNTAADLATLQNERLLVSARRYFPRVTFAADYLTAKLTAAEADLSRQLRTLFQPTMILPFSASAAEVASYTGASEPVPVYQEPGYDYSASLFTGDAWGMIETRQKPVISVSSITFNYPDLSSPIYTIPAGWIRVDNKFGVIQLVPDQNQAQISLNGYLLSMLGGGASVPFMMQIRYMAGLTDIRNNYPDIVDLVFKLAVLNILDDSYFPASSSTSADGLSQSLSLDADKWRESIEKRIGIIRRSLSGIRMTAF